MPRSRSILMPTALDAQVRAIADQAGVRVSDQIVKWILEGVARDGPADAAPPRDNGRGRQSTAAASSGRGQVRR